MSEFNKKVLLFSAHPDDHVCCAGTLMYFKDRGYEITEVVATAGEAGTWWDEEGNKKENFDQKDLVELRKGEISKASEVIGIDKSICLGLPDSKVVKSFDAIEKVLKIIREEKPALVITHNPVDYHSDHIAVSEIVTDGIHRAAWTCWPELGESYKTPILLYMEGFYLRRADFVMDVTKYKDRKEALLDVYGSQLYQAERDLLNSINNYRSFSLRDHNKDSAEAFEISEHFPVSLDLLLKL